ncbi:unnamed protein product [Prorocentrum cordatum]|uniref:Uncharacterized protein n=1 Tax=Prorocentrum cordatum TaxID=2364126 RepID=A0ABN9V6K4_9DINO|nr:unnamed protein product [Polarella glacialis]
MASTFHVVRYRVGGPPLWHERLTLGEHGGLSYIVAPDLDDYDEPNLPGPDMRAVLRLTGQGDTPPGLVGATVHRFRRLRTAGELWAAVSRSVAAGYPPPPKPLPLALAAGNKAGAPPGPFPLADPAAAPAAPAAPAGVPPLAAGVGGASPLAAPGGALAVVPGAAPAAAAALGAGPGLPALAAALGGAPPAAAGAPLPAWVRPPPPAVPGAAAAAAAAVRGASVAAAAAAGGDFRISPMQTDVRGERERRFGETANALTEMPVQVWPVQGPRALLWCLAFMSTVAGTPTAWHQRWLTALRLPDDDEYAKLHEALCRVLDLAVVYDQLQVSKMASFEVVARQLQLLEGRAYETRVPSAGAAAPAAKAGSKVSPAASGSAPETSFFLGAGVSKANLCISPKLLECIAELMKAEAAISKGRPTARGRPGLTSGLSVGRARVAPASRIAPSLPIQSDSETFCLSVLFLWSEGESRVRPYNEELVSWPKHVGAPCVGPRLRFRPPEYAGFLLRLDQAGVLEWEVADRRATFSTGFFFVEKSNDVNLRLVFDARVANLSFATPPSAWSVLEASGDLYVARGGMQCSFYHVKLPPHQHGYFSMPVVLNWHLGFERLGGLSVGTNSYLQPFVAVMPVGWSWALHFCQSAFASAILVSDVMAAGYVDNFASVSMGPDLAAAACQAIREVLEVRGLPVGAFAAAAQRVVFMGLDILGDVGVVGCKSDRRSLASPLAPSAVVGHCAWGMAANGPILLILNSVYRFMALGTPAAAPPWPSVIAELRAAAALIPL